MTEAPENLDLTSPPSESSPEHKAQGMQPLCRARRLSLRFLLSRLALLAGVVGAAGLVAWKLNENRHGAAGSELVIFSVVTCTVSAGTALWVVGITTGGGNSFSGMMLSILFRTLGPLAAGAVWQQSHPGWPIGNLIQIHVPIFLVSLTLETILVVDIVSSSVRFQSTLIESNSGKGRVSR